MKPLHICLKVPGNANWMGGAQYTKNLVRAIMSLPEMERSHIRLSLAASPSSVELMEDIQDQVDNIYTYGYALTRSCQNLADRISLLPPSLFNPLNIDFLYPNEAVTRSAYSWAGWIPDFQHKYLPEFFTAEQIETRDADWSKIAETAPLVILSSQMAQNDFHRFYPNAASRSAVMNFSSYMAPEEFSKDPITAQERYGLPDKFFLVCNQFHAHKNHMLVIDSLGALKQKGICPSVVFTGNFSLPIYQKRWEEMQSKIDQHDIRQQLFFLGLIPRSDQLQIMRRSLAVIQPSLFEGWSTVVEDAKALGKTIILSDFPVHIEQQPKHGIFFNQSDAHQLADCIYRAQSELSPGPEKHSEQIAKAKNHSETVKNGRIFLDIISQTMHSQK